MIVVSLYSCLLGNGVPQYVPHLPHTGGTIQHLFYKHQITRMLGVILGGKQTRFYPIERQIPGTFVNVANVVTIETQENTFQVNTLWLEEQNVWNRRGTDQLGENQARTCCLSPIHTVPQCLGLNRPSFLSRQGPSQITAYCPRPIVLSSHGSSFQSGAHCRRGAEPEDPQTHTHIYGHPRPSLWSCTQTHRFI